MISETPAQKPIIVTPQIHAMRPLSSKRRQNIAAGICWNRLVRIACRYRSEIGKTVIAMDSDAS
jgi:hypothetical protein